MGKAAQPSVNAAASSWWRSAAAWSVNTCLTCLLHINHICLLGNRKPRLHHAWTPHHFQRGVKLSSSPNLLIARGQGHVDETSWSRNQAHKRWTPSFCLHIICVANRRHSCCSTTRNHMGALWSSIVNYPNYTCHLSTTCYNSSELLRSQRLLHKAQADSDKCLEGQVTCVLVNQRVNPFEEWHPHFLSIQFT